MTPHACRPMRQGEYVRLSPGESGKVDVVVPAFRDAAARATFARHGPAQTLRELPVPAMAWSLVYTQDLVAVAPQAVAPQAVAPQAGLSRMDASTRPAGSATGSLLENGGKRRVLHKRSGRGSLLRQPAPGWASA